MTIKQRLARGTGLLAGGVLLTAAVLKSGGSEPPTFGSVAAVTVGVTLGGLLVLRPGDRRLRAAAAGLFAVFLAMNVAAAADGKSRCGCFGDLDATPQATATLDAVVLLLLAAGLFVRTAPRVRPPAFAGWAAAAAAIVCVSFTTAKAADIGTSAIGVSPAVVDVGERMDGETVPYPITLTNRTDTPARLLSAYPGCSCGLAEQLPLDIPAYGSVTVNLRVPVRGTPGRFARRLELYFDHPAHTRGSLELRGQLRPRQVVATLD